ncbi:hypothetical protein BV25DRAFT_1917933 [Artomyces pyxidatus]|uniref:Uncharacterized protein n=1 Tax=Artomyces pyxidatus TaxID=48021 RepID=A0ACB8SUZ1_9AGAM|nr:hypothetical protein BV25DRAFT_1917933 [Artomyces pyxidatus]
MPRKGSAKLTAAQKARRKEKQLHLRVDLADAQEEFLEKAKTIAKEHGRSMAWVTGQLYVGSKKLGKSRKNAWAAFLRNRLAIANQDLPAGARMSVVQFIRKKATELREEFKALSPEELEALREESAELRKEKATSVRQSQKSVDKDFAASFNGVNQEIQSIIQRTGCEVMMVAVRGNVSHYQAPHTFFSPRGESFVKQGLERGPGDLALQFEGFVVGGVDKGKGAKSTMTQVVSSCRSAIQSGLGELNQAEPMHLLLTSTDEILFQKFRHTPGSVEINYSNYEGKIVERYGVDLTPWPLEGRVRNPGDLKRAEVDRLWNALSGGHCRWVTLTRGELDVRIACNQARQDAGENVYKARRAPKKKNAEDASEPENVSSPGSANSSTGQEGSGSSLLEEFEAAAHMAIDRFEARFDEAAGPGQIPPDVAKALAEFDFSDFDPTLSARLGMEIDPTVGSEGGLGGF